MKKRLYQFIVIIFVSIVVSYGSQALHVLAQGINETLNETLDSTRENIEEIINFEENDDFPDIGPSGELPRFTDFLNKVIYDDGDENKRTMRSIITNDGSVAKARKIWCDGEFKFIEDCSNVGSGGSGAAGDPGACVLANSEDLTDNKMYEVDLIVDGTNICAGPGGCRIDAWSMHDSDRGSNAGKFQRISMGGLYIENSEQEWRYDDSEISERAGKNGDSTAQKIIFRITDDNTDCELIDDEASIETSPDKFVLNDSDGTESCYVQICSNTVGTGGTTIINQSSQWSESGNDIYRMTGRVGIGDDTPDHHLDVEGRINGNELCINGDCISDWSQVGGGPVSIPVGLDSQETIQVDHGSEASPYDRFCSSGYVATGVIYDNAGDDKVDSLYCREVEGTGVSFGSTTKVQTRGVCSGECTRNCPSGHLVTGVEFDSDGENAVEAIYCTQVNGVSLSSTQSVPVETGCGSGQCNKNCSADRAVYGVSFQENGGSTNDDHVDDLHCIRVQ